MHQVERLGPEGGGFERAGIDRQPEARLAVLGVGLGDIDSLWFPAGIAQRG